MMHQRPDGHIISRAYLHQPFARSFGVEESKLDSSLVDKGAIRAIWKTSKQGSEQLRWTLRSNCWRAWP